METGHPDFLKGDQTDVFLHVNFLENNGVMMYKVVLLRHGESTWNKENRFTGWTDVDLSEKGKGEKAKKSRRASEKKKASVFDIAYISVFKKSNQNFVDCYG